MNKSANRCLEAFKKIIKEGRKPNIIYSDDGNEFKGECKKYLQDNNIQILIAKTKVKASVVERFNRTLKEKMFRYFTYNQNIKYSTNLHKKRYIEVLPKLIDSYNNSYHRSIKTTPAKVNKSNENQIYINLYGYSKTDGDNRSIEIKYKVGMYVRKIKDKKLFEKGYTNNWSKDIYIIKNIIAQVPPLYELEELENESIKKVQGLYYEQEIQRVELPFDTYIVHEESKDKLLVEKLNSEESQKILVDKTEFIKNKYSLRKR